MSDDHKVHTCGGTGCEVCALRAQLATEARNAGARATELWAFVQYVRSREHTIAEMDAYADRLHDEGPYEIGARIIADLTAARSRADALEGEAGEMRAGCGAMREALETLGRKSALVPWTLADTTIVQRGLSGTAGKRAAEVIAASRRLERAIARSRAGGKRDTVSLADNGADERDAFDLFDDVRAALAALDGGGESNGK